jgi:hypothetical protein
MKIREGAYYRTRNGRVIGPMKHVDYRAEKWKFWAVGFNDGAPCWTDEGRWSDVEDMHEMDLIREVYVSDTPPAVQETEAKWRARLLAAGPGPLIQVHDRKTLRDEFAMAALLGMLARYDYHARDVARDAYEYADAMTEARKK